MSDFKDFKKFGIKGILSDDNIRKLSMYKAKYHDFRSFYRSLAMRYMGNNIIRPKIYEAMKSVTEAMNKIDDILAGKIRDKKDFDLLQTYMDKISSDIDVFVALSQTDDEFSSKIGDTNKSTGISLERLSVSQKYIQKGTKEQSRPNLGKIGSAITSNPAFGYGKDMLKGAITAGLGPFASLGHVAFGGISGLYKSIRDFNASKKQRLSEGALHGISIDAQDETREIIAKNRMKNDVFGNSFMNQAKVSEKPKSVFSPFQSNDKKLESLGIFDFFNTYAFKARWTKDIYDAIVKNKSSKSGGETGGGFLKNFLMWTGIDKLLKMMTGKFKAVVGAISSFVLGIPFVGKAVKAVGGVISKSLKTAGLLASRFLSSLTGLMVPALSVLASAVSGWVAGKAIRDKVKINGKSIGQYLNESQARGQDRFALINSAAGNRRADPLISRALKYQASGMSVKESLDRARVDLGDKFTRSPSSSEILPSKRYEIPVINQKRDTSRDKDQSKMLIESLSALSRVVQKMGESSAGVQRGKSSGNGTDDALINQMAMGNISV